MDPSLSLQLFEIVLNHLTGYDIFPLNERRFLTDQINVVKNLERDAEFYQLADLRAKASVEVKRLVEERREQEAKGRP